MDRRKMLKLRKELTMCCLAGVSPEKRLGTLGNLAPSVRYHCLLCGEDSFAVVDIPHKSDCVLASPEVTHVRLVACRATVELEARDGMLWWKSLNGTQYVIKPRGGAVHVFYAKDSGEIVLENVLLREIHEHIRKNQGVL